MGGNVSTTTPSLRRASAQRHARHERSGRPGRWTSTTTVAVVCASLFMSLSPPALVVGAGSTRRNGLTASKAPATTTASTSSSSSDFVAIYYNLYTQQTSSALSLSSPVAFKQSVPTEIKDRLDRYSLQFADLPELLKRAMLWESGYSLGDSASLAQIHTLCGLSMAQIALSEEEFKASTCDTTSCTGSPADWSYSNACRSDQLLPVAKCASTAIDTVSSMPLWSSKELPSNASEVTVVPNIQARRHKWPDQDAASSSISDDTPASSSLSKCPAKPSMVIPCIPYSPSPRGGTSKPTTEEWCRPEPGALVTSWLRQVAKEKQFSLLHLTPILISVALGVAGVAIYIRRKTFKRFELKTDGNGGTGCRGNTTASTPDGTYASGPFSFLNRSSVVMVDARLSVISSSSPIESFAAFSLNNVLSTLVNHPSLRLNTVVFDQIQFGNLLSEESSSSSSSCSRSEVWLASVRGTHVAVKRLSRAKKAEFEELEEFMREITLNAALDHPNIAKFIGVAWTTHQNLCVLTEYVDKGDLQLYLRQHCLQLAWEKAKMRIAMGIASGICHLHHQQQPNVVHHDLKSKNVLLTTELEPKLINTGVGRSRLSELVTAAPDSEENQALERSYWTAPEALQGERHSEKSDMFAFGVLLSELDTHQLPYEGLKCMATGNDLPPLEILQKVVAGELKPATSPFCPLEIAELIDACLDLDPQKRPSASEAMVALAKVPIANVGVKTYSF